MMRITRDVRAPRVVVVGGLLDVCALGPQLRDAVRVAAVGGLEEFDGGRIVEVLGRIGPLDGEAARQQQPRHRDSRDSRGTARRRARRHSCPRSPHDFPTFFRGVRHGLFLHVIPKVAEERQDAVRDAPPQDDVRAQPFHAVDGEDHRGDFLQVAVVAGGDAAGEVVVAGQ